MKKAIQRRADHWLPARAEAGLPVKELCRRHGFSEGLLPVAQQIWQDERFVSGNPIIPTRGNRIFPPIDQKENDGKGRISVQ